MVEPESSSVVGHRLSVPRHRSVHMGTASKSSGRELLDSLVSPDSCWGRCGGIEGGAFFCVVGCRHALQFYCRLETLLDIKRIHEAGGTKHCGQYCTSLAALALSEGPIATRRGRWMGNCQSNAWKLDASCGFFLTGSVEFSFVSIQLPLRRPIGVFLPGRSSRSWYPWLPP